MKAWLRDHQELAIRVVLDQTISVPLGSCRTLYEVTPEDSVPECSANSACLYENGVDAELSGHLAERQAVRDHVLHKAQGMGRCFSGFSVTLAEMIASPMRGMRQNRMLRRSFRPGRLPYAIPVSRMREVSLQGSPATMMMARTEHAMCTFLMQERTNSVLMSLTSLM